MNWYLQMYMYIHFLLNQTNTKYEKFRDFVPFHVIFLSIMIISLMLIIPMKKNDQKQFYGQLIVLSKSYTHVHLQESRY